MLKKRLLSVAEIFGSGRIPTSASTDLFNVQGGGDHAVHECYVEEGMASSWPIVIVPYNDEIDSFFADVATYYPTLSPISAHMHCIRRADMFDKRLQSRGRAKFKTGSGETSRQVLSTWSALAYCEAFSLSIAHFHPEQEPTFALARRTLSYCFARAAFLYPELHLDAVRVKWELLRELTNPLTGSPLAETLTFLGNLILGRCEPIRSDIYVEIKPVVEELWRGEINESHFVSYLLEHHPGIQDSVKSLSGDFDGRMDAFQKIADQVKIHPHSPGIDTITLAFFADRILPGSMRYTRILSRHIERYPAVLLWYGLFSSMSKKYDKESIAVGIDRKIQRDITCRFDLDTAPSVDISVDELNVLSRISVKAVNIRPVDPRSVLVSLLPGIDLFVRFGDESVSHQEKRDSVAAVQQMRDRDRALEGLLAEAQRLLRQPNPDDAAFRQKTKSRSTRY